jgi:hypothetical protein
MWKTKLLFRDFYFPPKFLKVVRASPSQTHNNQGGQIGRIFAQCLLWAFTLNITYSLPFFTTFFVIKGMHWFWQKMVRATFWAIFFTNSCGHPEPNNTPFPVLYFGLLRDDLWTSPWNQNFKQTPLKTTRKKGLFWSAFWSSAHRVTRWVCEKIAQNFVKFNALTLTVEKVA